MKQIQALLSAALGDENGVLELRLWKVQVSKGRCKTSPKKRRKNKKHGTWLDFIESPAEREFVSVWKVLGTFAKGSP